MKKILKAIIPIVLALVIPLICCIVLTSTSKFNFQETSDFKYIENNVDNIEMFAIRTKTLLGEHCYKINIDDG